MKSFSEFISENSKICLQHVCKRLAARILVRMHISWVYPNIATCSKSIGETSHGRANFAVRRKIGEFHGCTKPTDPNNPFFSFFFSIKKKWINNIYVSVQRVVSCLHQSDRLGCHGISHQSDRLIRVCISHQSQRRFCSLVWEVFKVKRSNGGFGERAVRKMESSFRTRNVGFSVFLTCILPRLMGNAILPDRWKISDYL